MSVVLIILLVRFLIARFLPILVYAIQFWFVCVANWYSCSFLDRPFPAYSSLSDLSMICVCSANSYDCSFLACSCPAYFVFMRLSSYLCMFCKLILLFVSCSLVSCRFFCLCDLIMVCVFCVHWYSCSCLALSFPAYFLLMRFKSELCLLC